MAGRPLLLRTLLLVLLASRPLKADTIQAYGELYRLGTEAYLEESYQHCVTLLRQALDDYHNYQQHLVECRFKCRLQASNEPLLTDDESPELKHFEKLIRQTRCLVECHRQRYGAHLQAYYDSASADEDFRQMKPYEYLQLCFFKTGELQNAANAVFTVLTLRPNDQVMQENFKYYSEMEEVDMEKIVSFERQIHAELYLRGNDAYQSEKYDHVVQLMEESLDQFYEAENNCRDECERFFKQGYNPDFVANVANHFAYVLRCKLRCQDRISTIAGNLIPDYLPSHYHYLQFAYYKQGQLREACANVATYLMFRPDDVDMLQNKDLYMAQEDAQKNFFVPRQEAVLYLKSRDKEEKLDKYILDNFRFDDKENKTKGNTTSAMPDALGHSQLLSAYSQLISDDRRSAEPWTERARVVNDSKQLQGRERLVADGFLTESECNKLIDLLKSAGVQGDGYRKKSPHTEYEEFLGLSFARLMLSVARGEIRRQQLETLIDVADAARQFVAAQFGVEHLYSSFTHLASRKPKETLTKQRPASDISHQIHVDNCVLMRNGTCSRGQGAYIYRDYSAILYLNDNFEGGEFVFADTLIERKPAVLVKPRCGRLVAFSAGEENPHGVLAVTSGVRYALAMWYTLTWEQQEQERMLAEIYLQHGNEPEMKEILSYLEQNFARSDAARLKSGTQG